MLRLIYLLVTCTLGSFVSNPQYVLYDRLMNSYRVDFVQTDESCNRTEWETSENDVDTVPSKCLEYVVDPSAAYSPNVRPVVDSSKPVVVNFSVSITQLAAINERDQYMETAATLRFKWFDEFLTWRPDMNSGIETISLPMDKIWRPDVIAWNDLNPKGMGMVPVNVVLRYDGQCSWLPLTQLKTTCDTDMTYFPFDSQTCSIIFGSWTQTKNLVELKFTNPSNETELESAPMYNELYSASTEWELVSSKAVLNEIKYSCCPDIYQDATFHFVQKRYSYQPVLVLLVPCIITAMLILLTFFLPPDAGEKVGLNITILLAMVVFMDQLSGQMPPMPDTVPVIGTFFVASMIIITASLVSTIICLRLHHTVGDDAVNMPGWMRSLFLNILPRLLLMKSCKKVDVEVDDESSASELSVKIPPNSELGQIYAELKFISNRMKAEDRDAECENDWKYAAAVFDRSCAVVYFIGLLGTFLGTVMSAPDM